MAASVQCPRCSGSQISQQTRHRNAKNGNTVGGWLPGCLLQLVMVSALVAAGGLFVRIQWPAQLFAEAALLTAAIAVIYAVGVGIFALYVRRWPLVNELTCSTCGHKWYVQLSRSSRRDAQALSTERSTG